MSGLSPEPYGRLVFGESDNLPGLVLDRFDDVIVGQIATAGMEALRPAMEAAVREVLKPRLLYWKNDSASRELEHLPAFSGPAFGEADAQLRIREAGIDFAAPLAEGQKTGWFYDQTANRALLGRFLSKGARVLDVCSYVGAWAITALKTRRRQRHLRRRLGGGTGIRAAQCEGGGICADRRCAGMPSRC